MGTAIQKSLTHLKTLGFKTELAKWKTEHGKRGLFDLLDIIGFHVQRKTTVAVRSVWLHETGMEMQKFLASPWTHRMLMSGWHVEIQAWRKNVESKEGPSVTRFCMKDGKAAIL